MMFPEVPAEVWSKRYGLSMEGRPCKKCGKMQMPTIPFATQEWRGLKAEEDECGPQYTLRCMILADPNERAEWLDTVRQLTGDTDETR